MKTISTYNRIYILNHTHG